MSQPNHKIAIYARAASVEQAAPFTAIDHQTQVIKEFIKNNNANDSDWGRVVDTYIDAGVSALAAHKPGYQRMLADLRKGKINCIVVTDIARLSRSPLDTLTLVDIAQEHSASIFVVGDGSAPWNLCDGHDSSFSKPEFLFRLSLLKLKTKKEGPTHAA